MNKGKDFENDVCHLLKLQGWQVIPEHLVGHKKIDAYAEKFGEFGENIRIAIECKDYSSPLKQKQVTHIYSNYLPLIQQNLIDKIILITRNDISPSAKTYTINTQDFIHITLFDHVILLDVLLYLEMQ